MEVLFVFIFFAALVAALIYGFKVSKKRKATPDLVIPPIFPQPETPRCATYRVAPRNPQLKSLVVYLDCEGNSQTAEFIPTEQTTSEPSIEICATEIKLEVNVAIKKTFDYCNK